VTAHLYWDRAWRTQQGRAAWSEPDPWVVSSVGLFHARGARDLLDLGCGVGRHALYLSEEGFAVRAVDRSAAAVSFAGAEATARGLATRIEQADVTALPFPSDSMDVVLAFNVVYHADEDGLARALEEVRRVLRPDGLYQTTMLSKRNVEAGRGTEVAPNTFVQPGAGDDKVHPHLYVDAADLVRLHTGFQLLSAFDAEQTAAGSYHWHCVFEASQSPVVRDGAHPS
jgi:SAM-dependent methyltransferase